MKRTLLAVVLAVGTSAWAKPPGATKPFSFPSLKLTAALPADCRGGDLEGTGSLLVSCTSMPDSLLNVNDYDPKGGDYPATPDAALAEFKKVGELLGTVTLVERSGTADGDWCVITKTTPENLPASFSFDQKRKVGKRTLYCSGSAKEQRWAIDLLSICASLKPM
jgi:hypothetical protein